MAKWKYLRVTCWLIWFRKKYVNSRLWLYFLWVAVFFLFEYKKKENKTEPFLSFQLVSYIFFLFVSFAVCSLVFNSNFYKWLKFPIKDRKSGRLTFFLLFVFERQKLQRRRQRRKKHIFRTLLLLSCAFYVSSDV